MLFRKKNNTAKNNYSLLEADIHSHLLPGIDDGAADLSTSISLIKGMMELGYKKLVTTPHIMWDMYQNTSEIILEKHELLKQRIKDEGLDVEIAAAAEYFIDDHLGELLKQKTPLLTFGNNFVLVEFSLASAQFELKDILFEMQMQGYQPVIAHPERYIYFERNKDFFETLKDAGCLFQLNVLSLNGFYGKATSELAHYLAKKQYYDLIGSDLHHVRHLNALNNSSLISSVNRLMDTGKIINPQL
jgi:tyrosine-protein phosphatase YwqE